MTREKAQEIFTLLKSHYPHAKMILQWGNNFELLVAIILSAQCTDKKVNEVTSTLFPKYRKRRKEFEKLYKQYTSFILSEAKDPLTNKSTEQSEQTRKDFVHQYQEYSRMFYSKGKALRVKGEENSIVIPAKAGIQESFGSRIKSGMTEEQLVELVNLAFVPLHELEQDIKSTGFYHAKAKSVQGAAKTVLEKFNGILPRSIAELTTIPGVGRKTANVFLTNAYHINEGIAVDTHVTKQAKLLGLTNNTDPVKIEQDLMQLFPKNEWHDITYMLIEHGRNVRKKAADRIRCSDPKCLLCLEK